MSAEEFDGLAVEQTTFFAICEKPQPAGLNRFQ
jgi:hypothetical protein